jgi:hypothetical protein
MTGLYKRTTPSMSTTPLDDIKNQIDNYYLLGTLLEYRLARNIFLDLKYSFAMRDSNKDSAQTKESRYMLELKVDELFNLYPKK